MMHKKNEKLLLQITDITSEGAGVGRSADGYVVFVPQTAPGDEAEVLLVKAGKDWGFGKLLTLCAASPMRTAASAPDCEGTGRAAREGASAPDRPACGLSESDEGIVVDLRIQKAFCRKLAVLIIEHNEVHGNFKVLARLNFSEFDFYG